MYPGLGEIQWINYPELGFEDTFQRVVTAIDTDREWVGEYISLKEKAREWDSKGRNESFLLRGMELQEAVTWLAKVAVVKEPKPLPCKRSTFAQVRNTRRERLRALKGLQNRRPR